MSKNHLIAFGKLCSLVVIATGGLMFASCAKDGFDDESFDSSVKNSQLATPTADNITVTASADGKTQTFSWPVVHGAGGYLVSLYNTEEMDDPIVRDTLVDGCSVTLPREEDLNYQFTIQTKGRSNLNNNDAAEMVTYLFTTFSPSLATIPAGSDLYQWFAENPVPDSEETIYYDLEAGGQYTLSKSVDFSTHAVVLRTASKSDWATVTPADGAALEYCGSFGLKYLIIDGSMTDNPLLAFSANPPASILDASHNNHNQITRPTSIQKCSFIHVQGMILYDNKVKYCLKDFVMDDCTIQLEPTGGMSNSSVFYVYDGGGFINDFTMTNTTVWNANANTFKYLIRYNNSGRCDRAGYTTNSINIKNCTMYNVVKTGQMCNHGGFDGQATSNYDVENNIFVDCGSHQVARRFVGRLNDAAKIVFNNNTYWFDGEANDQTGYDTGYILTTDPAFANAAEGDFRPSGAEQLSMKTGDPRWLPSAE